VRQALRYRPGTTGCGVTLPLLRHTGHMEYIQPPAGES
jgi:hypothetical protein